MDITAAYTGTFDPITHGHTDVIERAAAMYNRVIVAIAESPSKRPLFDLSERVALARSTVSHLDNVSVDGFSGLVVDFAREQGVSVLVRGVRSVGDFDVEKQMAVMNRHLAPEVDTAMLAPSPEYNHISATLVREIALLGGNVGGLVHPEVDAALARRARERGQQ
jgi:pantetheine-phosphate adenylyltransferase